MRLLIGPVLVVALATTSCFSPAPRDGVVACNAEGECPPSLVCASDRLCYRMCAAQPDDAAGPPACADGMDDDDDGRTDFPDDPGCSCVDDPSELGDTACDNGIDDDCDGVIDEDDDPGCAGPDDDSERGSAECDDGIDNDGDGQSDFHPDGACVEQPDGDLSCGSPSDDES